MLLVVWSAWVTTTWVTNSSTRIMRVSDAKCAYCERQHWARETGNARNLVADRQVSLPDGRYCHARCFGHYDIEVGLAEVLGMTRPRQRQLARARRVGGAMSRLRRAPHRSVQRHLHDVVVDRDGFSAEQRRGSDVEPGVDQVQAVAEPVGRGRHPEQLAGDAVDDLTG